MRETLTGCLACTPAWKSNPQTRYVPWLRSDTETFRRTGWCSNQLGHLAVARKHWLRIPAEQKVIPISNFIFCNYWLNITKIILMCIYLTITFCYSITKLLFLCFEIHQRLLSKSTFSLLIKIPNNIDFVSQPTKPKILMTFCLYRTKLPTAGLHCPANSLFFWMILSCFSFLHGTGTILSYNKCSHYRAPTCDIIRKSDIVGKIAVSL